MIPSSVSARVRELTLDECAQALGVRRGSSWLARGLLLPFDPVASRLGRELEQFDWDLATVPLREAARSTLRRFGVEWYPNALELPTQGPLLIVANHPGAYDALSLFATLDRDDVAIVVAERAFLRALPALDSRFIFVPDLDPQGVARASARGRGLRQALQHLRRGGALLQFGAGCIEPDPAFHSEPSCILPWQTGTGALAAAALRASGRVAVAVVSGVHSRRAKRSLLVRAAEARGVTTLAVLLQLALPYYSTTHVRIASRLVDSIPPDAVQATRRLESIARELATSTRW
jgi:muconolactone delta-isomerase